MRPVFAILNSIDSFLARRLRIWRFALYFGPPLILIGMVFSTPSYLKLQLTTTSIRFVTKPEALENLLSSLDTTSVELSNFRSLDLGSGEINLQSFSRVKLANTILESAKDGATIWVKPASFSGIRFLPRTKLCQVSIAWNENEPAGLRILLDNDVESGRLRASHTHDLWCNYCRTPSDLRRSMPQPASFQFTSGDPFGQEIQFFPRDHSIRLVMILGSPQAFRAGGVPVVSNLRFQELQRSPDSRVPSLVSTVLGGKLFRGDTESDQVVIPPSALVGVGGLKNFELNEIRIQLKDKDILAQSGLIATLSGKAKALSIDGRNVLPGFIERFLRTSFWLQATTVISGVIAVLSGVNTVLSIMVTLRNTKGSRAEHNRNEPE